jgi:hypothetical protein
LKISRRMMHLLIFYMFLNTFTVYISKSYSGIPSSSKMLSPIFFLQYFKSLWQLSAVLPLYILNYFRISCLHIILKSSPKGESVYLIPLNYIKKLFLLAWFHLGCCISVAAQSHYDSAHPVYVKGCYRKNGTCVQAHYRAKPSHHSVPLPKYRFNEQSWSTLDREPRVQGAGGEKV